MVFQDPFSTLNPRMSVEAMLGEPLMLYENLKSGKRRQRVFKLLETVGLRPEQAVAIPMSSRGDSARGWPLHGHWH